jgi:hypothetical protein
MLALEAVTVAPHGALVYESFCVWIKVHMQLFIEQLTQFKIKFCTDYLVIIDNDYRRLSIIIMGIIDNPA